MNFLVLFTRKCELENTSSLAACFHFMNYFPPHLGLELQQVSFNMYFLNQVSLSLQAYMKPAFGKSVSSYLMHILISLLQLVL